MQFILKKRSGYTIIEMLVALVVGSLIIIGAFSFFIVIGKFTSEQLLRDQLNSKLSHLASVISRELTRAGYCNDCTGTNPFLLKDSKGNFSAVMLGTSAVATQGTCARFAYNTDNTSVPTAVATNHRKGFRLGKSDLGNNTIEMYAVYSTSNNWTCTGSRWQDMVGDEITIDTFKFERTIHQAGTNKLQKIVVTIGAFWTEVPSISDSVQFTVIPNNIDG
ncbi:MAG: prepilin-type N-terminal cleavage/methylation domain-containing protein [Vibrionaceae bacterium]